MILQQLDITLPQHSYPIYIGENLFNDVTILRNHIPGKQVMIVTNKTLEKLYLTPLQRTLKSFQVNTLVLEDGEQFKNLAHWELILNALTEHQHHRDTTLITLGGGVIGDMGGFAAACYQRGIPFIQIPTTLLAQVDASIGGKTAVNHSVGKNLIGAFHQPNAVIIDLNTLKTLAKREFHAGLAEIVKAALIKDADFFSWLETSCPDILNMKQKTLAEAVKRACEIKKHFVVADEKEAGIRAHLNLGHTFAHAIEKSLGYGTWLHGEAVACGLVLAAQLSQQQGLISQQETQRIQQLLEKMQLPTQLPKELSLDVLLAHMQMDKKILQNKLRFILLEQIGQAIISDQITSHDLKKIPQFS